MTRRPAKKLTLGESEGRTLGGLDKDDPTHRTAAALYLILKNQVELLGHQPGSVPLDERFASERSRGALMGTAIAVVRGHREAPEPDDYIDAIVAAFTVVFGEAIGEAQAHETIKQSGAKNAAVNSASDRAGQDTIDNWSDDSASRPMAYYRAVIGTL